MDIHGTAARAGLARRTREDVPNFLSLMVFFLVTALLFRSWEFALIVTASLGFHELGHAAALSYLGLEWRITFGLVGAWTWSPGAERARLSQLANAVVHLAGPVFSLLLALLALTMHALWHPVDEHLLTLANFSAQVGFLNLLPLGNLTDGGKIVHRMITSLDRPARAWAVLLPLLVSALMLVIYSLFQIPVMGEKSPAPFLLGLLLVGFWLASSLAITGQWRLARRKHPQWRSFGVNMTRQQAYALIVVVWVLLALGLIISAATPFWLSPEYLLGSLRNVVDVMVMLR